MTAAATMAEVEREAARFRGTEILNPVDRGGWRKLMKPRNLALTNADREAFARYATPYGVDTLLRRTKNVRNLQREFLVPLDQPHLVRWIRAQEAFLKTLSPREEAIIKSYTKHGDQMVNSWARGRMQTDIRDLMMAAVGWSRIPFQYSIYEQYDRLVREGVKMRSRAEWLDARGVLRSEVVAEIVRENMAYFSLSANLGPLLKQYMAEILAIMKRSPRLIGDVVTYRGFKSEAHLKGLKYVAREFGSTSVNPETALAFADTHVLGLREVYCCLYELTVKAGVPCLYLGSLTEFDDEFEILLPPGATYRLGKKILVKRVVPPDMSLTEVLADPLRMEAMVVEGTVSWDARSGTRRASSGWSREDLVHVPRRKKPGKGRRHRTVRAGASSSERLDRISEALTMRSSEREETSE
jgi:hypothetical protein